MSDPFDLNEFERRMRRIDRQANIGLAIIFVMLIVIVALGAFK